MFPLFLEGDNVGLNKLEEKGCVEDDDAWVVGDARLCRLDRGISLRVAFCTSLLVYANWNLFMLWHTLTLAPGLSMRCDSNLV